MSILDPLGLAKILQSNQTQSNSPDRPLKHTNNIRYGNKNNDHVNVTTSNTGNSNISCR